MKRRSVAVAVAVAIGIVGEGVLGGSALAAHQLQQRRESKYAATLATINRLKKSTANLDATLSSTRHDIGSRNSEAAHAQAQVADAQRFLDAVTHRLNDARHASAQEDANLAALKFCNAAEATAGAQRAAGDGGGAVATLRAAEGWCATAAAADDPDPAALPFDFPDPSITRVGNTYYAYASNGPLGNVQLATSTDLRHWHLVGDALPFLPVWANPGNVWAPSVIALGGKFVMYYSPRTKGGNQCLGVAVASSPLGPFIDLATAPFECTSGYALDPKPFIDAHGQPWLIWKNGVGDAIWSQPLAPDGLSLTGAPTKLISADQAWEERMVEGPSLVQAGGELRLFYSGSDWSSSHYGVGEAICDTPAGPCRKVRGGPVLTSHDNTAGPGGLDFFTTTSGELWATFHAYKAPAVGYPYSRMLHVAPVRLAGDSASFGG